MGNTMTRTTPGRSRRQSMLPGERLSVRDAAKGVTLVELMIVVAIIGLLSGFAISSFRNYAIQARISGVIAEMQSIQQRIVEAQFLGDGFAVADNTLMPEFVSDKIEQVKIRQNVDGKGAVKRGRAFIVIRVTDDIYKSATRRKGQIRMEAEFGPGGIKWRCGWPADWPAGKIPLKYMPSSCREPINLYR